MIGIQGVKLVRQAPPPLTTPSPPLSQGVPFYILYRSTYSSAAPRTQLAELVLTFGFCGISLFKEIAFN